jgi:hypothetical protein
MLNILRTSRINPTISAATHLDGKYDHNRAPMAPPGTSIIEQETPNRRRMLIPQVRPAHKYPTPPWEMIHLPGGDNAVCR